MPRWFPAIEWRLPLLAAALCGAVAAAAEERLSSQRVWLFPSAPDGPGREGFLRVINRSDSGGEVRISGIDDDGQPSFEATLRSAGAAVRQREGSLGGENLQGRLA